MQVLRFLFAVIFVGIALFITIAWTPDIAPETLKAKYAYGASSFMELPSGTTAHYRDEGPKDASPIVLLHGSNSSLHTWEAWVDNLKANYRVITVDLPGHGLTGATPDDDYTYSGMTRFLKEFTTQLGLNSFTLGGNSMGGGISLNYTLTHPDDVTSLILVDAAGISLPQETDAKTDLPIAFKLAGRWYSDWIIKNITPRGLSEEGLRKSITDQSLIDDKMVDRYWELVRFPGNRHATGKRFTWYREGRSDLEISNITVPALILWGKDDKIIPVEVGYAMEQKLKNSELIVFENAGHIPMEEIPVKTLEAVNIFLRT